MLASLRAAYPGATIDWLVNRPFAPAVAAHPMLSGVVPFDRSSLSVRTPRAALQFLRSLRRARYDMVFDVQGLARSGLFAWATGAPRRVGLANARELGYLGLTEKHRVDPQMHSVERMLEVVRLAGIAPVRDMRLYTPADESRAWEREASISGARYAVIAPTSRWHGKRWPEERFAALIPRLFEAGVQRVVLVGSASERAQCSALLAAAEQDPARIIDRIGGTTVGGLMAIIERSSLVVANDSAALHMAVGFDRPCVALFGPTRVDLVGPYRREADVIQHVSPDDPLDHKNEQAGRRLMERITIDEVASACARRLAVLGPA